MVQHRFYADIKDEYEYSKLHKVKRLRVNKRLQNVFKEFIRNELKKVK